MDAHVHQFFFMEEKRKTDGSAQVRGGTAQDQPPLFLN